MHPIHILEYMPDAIKSVDVPSVHGAVVVNPDGTSIHTGLITAKYDKIAITQPTDTTELLSYSYGGETVSTILITFTDNTRSTISTIEKTA